MTRYRRTRFPWERNPAQWALFSPSEHSVNVTVGENGCLVIHSHIWTLKLPDKRGVLQEVPSNGLYPLFR